MTSPALQEVVALLGCPAAGNPAQYLFERMIAAAGLDWRFVSLEVDAGRIRDALAGAAAMGFRGCLLAGPPRAAVLDAGIAATAAATFAGAVSLVERQPTGLLGHMTDGRGVVEAVRAHLDPAGAPVLLVGAGATGRAVALELALAGAGEIVVRDADPARADDLVRSLAGVSATTASVEPGAAAITIAERIALVVSAVPASAARPADLTGLRPDLFVADVVLDASSRLAARARAAGACVIDGLEIHAARAAIDFQLLSGAAADTEMLREALDEFLST